MHSLVAKCVSLYKIMFVNIKSGYNNYCAVDIHFRFQAGYRNLASFLRGEFPSNVRLNSEGVWEFSFNRSSS